MKKILLALLIAAAAFPVASQSKRDLKFSIRDGKGKVLKKAEFSAFLSGGVDIFGRVDKRGDYFFSITDSDTLNLVIADKYYEIPLLGLDSVCITIGNPRKFLKAGKDIAQMDIGYGGTVSRETGTAAVGYLEMENVDGFSDLQAYMLGKIPGVRFRGKEIVIRGISTVEGNPYALIVLDGVPQADFASVNLSVNPRDVESISVLKDSSAAIYGTRGANGVVLITTKRPKME